MRGPRSDTGWKIEAWCPHGAKILIPMRVLRTLETIVDPCDEAVAERAAAEAETAASRKLTFSERRQIRRALKKIRDL
jgi:hypothetical protein